MKAALVHKLLGNHPCTRACKQSMLLKTKTDKIKIPSTAKFISEFHQLSESAITKLHPQAVNPSPWPTILSLDNATYTKVIQLSTKSGQLVHGKLAHAHLVKRAFKPCLFLWNTLLNMYCKSDELDNAQNLFDKMPKRDVTSWNLLISGYSQERMYGKAIEVFREAGMSGVKPDKFTYSSALAVCAKAQEVELGRVIHGLVIIDGLAGKAFLTNSLIDMYAKCGRVDKARLVFENAVELDDVSWNSMIASYVRNGLDEEVLRQFVKMLQCGRSLSSYVIGSVLKACCSDFTNSVECGRSTHGCVVKLGLDTDFVVRTSLLDMYAKHWDVSDAVYIFKVTPERNVIMYNAMIAGFVRAGSLSGEFMTEALTLFLEMQRQGIKPSMFTFSSILKACNAAEAFAFGKQIHAQICKNALQSDEFIGSGLVELYCSLGSVDDALKCFELISKLDMTSWTSLVSGLVQNGQNDRASSLFLEVMACGKKPHEFMISSMLSACASMSSLRSGEQMQGYALKTALGNFTVIQNAQIATYAESGAMDSAVLIFEEIEDPDIVSWSTMIRSYAQHGHPGEALNLFEKMRDYGIAPNQITFLGALTACSHGGLVEEGLSYFESMRADYGIAPNEYHFACIVDLLGRAGRLTEARELITASGFEDNPILWQALLSACRIHKDTIMAGHVAAKVFELKPHSAASYILLYNIYTEAGIQKPTAQIRNLMLERHVTKEPGLSWIEVGNIRHTFVAGDVSHPQSRLIYSQLKLLLKEIGELADRHASDRRDLAVDYHSEKLGVNLGF